ENDLPEFWFAFVGLGHTLLQHKCALDSVDGTGELYEGPVAHEFDNPAVMFSDEWLQHPRPSILERGKCAGFIGANQATIANYIRYQNGCKVALGTFFGHRGRRPSQGCSDAKCMWASPVSLSARISDAMAVVARLRQQPDANRKVGALGLF